VIISIGQTFVFVCLELFEVVVIGKIVKSRMAKNDLRKKFFNKIKLQEYNLLSSTCSIMYYIF
jgi:hypothetical protein